uniref:RHEB like 1 n=1 Tax=Cyanoderma ruficeps TaxID=181631 RepID=A0A8C3NXS1_9PASS
VPPGRHREVLLILGYRKTSMAHPFLEGKFVECYEPTVTSNKAVVVGKDELQLQLVDTARQVMLGHFGDEHTILPHSFIISIHGYILVYSVTSLQSFQVVKTLHSKLMPVVLVGNKADLSREGWSPPGVIMGIFMKLIEEINQVDNSYGRSTSCCLM